MKVTSDMVEQDEARQDQSMVCRMRNTNALVSGSVFALSVWSTYGLDKDVNFIGFEARQDNFLVVS